MHAEGQNGKLGPIEDGGNISPPAGILSPVNRLDNLELARVHKRGLRCHYVRTRRFHVPSSPIEDADERRRSARELAVNARVPSGDPLYSFLP